MSNDAIDHAYERGMSNRRRVLGNAWVDRSLQNANGFNAEFQNLITRFAWHEIWGRPALDIKMRRTIVLATTLALGRWEEYELHVRAAITDGSGDGLSEDELKEVLMQSAIYAGVPAANTAFALAQHILQDLKTPAVMAPAVPGQAVHPGVGRDGTTQSTPALRYSIRAPRNGKTARHTVVLSHALGCDLSMWDQLANALALDCRVICYDHRGHGGSCAPAGPYTMKDMAEDAARLLRELDSGPVVWIGLSMGAMVGQELVLRHPSLVLALVIANATSEYTQSAKLLWTQRINKVAREGVEAIAETVMERYFSEAFRAANPAIVARFRRRVASTDAQGYASCCAAVAAVNTSARLSTIGIPVLIVAGALDMGTPPAMSADMASRIPGATLAVIENAAHLSAIEAPAEFVTLTSQFLQSL